VRYDDNTALIIGGNYDIFEFLDTNTFKAPEDL